jgi:hypothetical protein
VIEYVNERLGLVSAFVALASLFLAVSASGLYIAAAVIGVGFLFGMPIWQTCRAIRNRHGEGYARWLAIACLWLAVGSLIYTIVTHLDKAHRDQLLESFVWVGGMATVFAVLVLIGVALPRVRRESKGCPECLATVKHEARVCRHCGYRWHPPL